MRYPLPALLERCTGCGKHEDDCACDTVELTPTQWDFVTDDRRFLYFNAGRGSGKTTAACWRIISMINDGKLPPGSRINIFGPTYPQLMDGTMKTFDYWMEREGLLVHKVDGNSPMRWLEGDIEVACRNASNPDQTRGRECRLVWLDEAAQHPEEVLRLTNMTLRQFIDIPGFQTLITTTPKGRNWLYRKFVDPVTRMFGDDKIGYHQTNTLEANRYGIVREDYIEESGYAVGTDQYNEQIMAQFVSWTGLVFDQYNREIHSDHHRFPDPSEFAVVYGGVDVGYSISPTAIEISGLTHNNIGLTFAEYYQPRANTHQWMDKLGELGHKHNVKVWYVDAAASAEIKAMQAAGLNAKPSMKAKDATGTAVSYLNGKLSRNEWFIDREKCPFLVSQIETYSLKEQQSGDEVTFLDKVKPNQPDHAIDAWKYHVLPMSSHSAQQSFGKVVEFSIGAR